jgi:hypothetical protein
MKGTPVGQVTITVHGHRARGRAERVLATRRVRVRRVVSLLDARYYCPQVEIVLKAPVTVTDVRCTPPRDVRTVFRRPITLGMPGGYPREADRTTATLTLRIGGASPLAIARQSVNV